MKRGAGIDELNNTHAELCVKLDEYSLE